MKSISLSSPVSYTVLYIIAHCSHHTFIFFNWSSLIYSYSEVIISSISSKIPTIIFHNLRHLINSFLLFLFLLLVYIRYTLINKIKVLLAVCSLLYCLFNFKHINLLSVQHLLSVQIVYFNFNLPTFIQYTVVII